MYKNIFNVLIMYRRKKVYKKNQENFKFAFEVPNEIYR